MNIVKIIVRMYGSTIVPELAMNYSLRENFTRCFRLTTKDLELLLAMYRIQQQPFFGRVS